MDGGGGGELLDSTEVPKLRLIVADRQTVARLQHHRHDVFRPYIFLSDRIVERLFIRSYDDFFQMVSMFHEPHPKTLPNTSEHCSPYLLLSYAIAKQMRQTNIIAD